MENNEKKETVWLKLLDIFQMAFKNVPSTIKTILVIVVTVFAMFTVFMWIFKHEIKEIIYQRPITEKEAKIIAENERRVNEINDSIALVRSAEKAKLASQYRREIQEEAVRVKYRLKNCIGVNYYSIHNGGETINVDGKWELDVYISTEIFIEDDYPEEDDDDENKYIYRGWAWLNNEALQKETPIFIPDVTQEPELYLGRSKFYLNQGGIKSCMVMLVENIGKEFLFVSFNFNITQPEVNNENLFRTMYNFRRFVKQRV